MFRRAFPAVAAIAITGCASTSNWQTLAIDGTSEADFDESVAVLSQELPQMRSQLLAIALEDIWMTAKIDEIEGDADTYTEADYLLALNGLNYDEVIELADSTGPSTLLRYTRGQRARASQDLAATWRRIERGYQTAPPAGAWSNPWKGLSPYPLNYR